MRLLAPLLFPLLASAVWAQGQAQANAVEAAALARIEAVNRTYAKLSDYRDRGAIRRVEIDRSVAAQSAVDPTLQIPGRKETHALFVTEFTRHPLLLSFELTNRDREQVSRHVLRQEDGFRHWIHSVPDESSMSPAALRDASATARHWLLDTDPLTHLLLGWQSSDGIAPLLQRKNLVALQILGEEDLLGVPTTKIGWELGNGVVGAFWFTARNRLVKMVALRQSEEIYQHITVLIQPGGGTSDEVLQSFLELDPSRLVDRFGPAINPLNR